MKHLLAIILAAFALSVTAAEPAPAPKEQKMRLAKKKDHSKDKKPAAPKAAPKKK